MAERAGNRIHDEERPAAGERVAEVVPLVVADSAGPTPEPRYRLPSFLGSFFGRAEETEELTRLLAGHRLVTLTGAGGVGKTRLAVEVAGRLANEQAFFVDLAPLYEPSQVREQIAEAFGLGELRGRCLAESLARELTGSALLVLDNCEHLIDACAAETVELLRTCPSLRMLATSQQRLGVPGEVVLALSGLEFPPPGRQVNRERALQAAAVQLFCDRATAVKHEFVPLVGHISAIVEVCGRLEGNPLAIALAASRVDVLTPADIAARLNERIDFLRGKAEGPARHETLEAALAWSASLLDEPQRELLARLSVFAGGFTLADAEAVCGGGEVQQDTVFEMLAGLVARSLVVADTSGTTARYRLLETVRHWAAARLAASGDTYAFAERHARWWASLAEQHTGVDDDDGWRSDDQIAHDNARAALDWSLAEGRAELALQLTGGLMNFWEGSGRFVEAQHYLGRALALEGPAAPALRAAARHDAGFSAFMLGDLDGARDQLAQSLELWAEAGDRAGEERTQGLMGFVSTFGGGPASIDDLEAKVEKLREADDQNLPEALLACGQARLFRGEPAAAFGHFQELVSAASRRGERGMAASGLVGCGSAAVGCGDYPAAESCLREGVGLASEVGAGWTMAVGTAWLAELARVRGDIESARRQFEVCLDQAEHLDAPYATVAGLLGLGRVLLDEDAPDKSRSLFEDAAEAAQRAGLPHLLAAATEAQAEAAVAAGEACIARALFDEAIAMARDCGDNWTLAAATFHLAELARAESDLARAGQLHHEVLTIREGSGALPGVTDSLEALAGLAAEAGAHEVAVRLFGAAQALRDTNGWSRAPQWQRAYDADLGRARAVLSLEAQTDVWRQGEAMTYEAALAYARRGRGSRSRPAKGLAALTPTERDIVALVTEGLTNPEIADRLFVSPRTVQSHLRNVYAKLNVSSRRELREMIAQS